EFIAKTRAGAKFPWRIIQIAKNDRELLESDLVYKLATPSKIKDTSWIAGGVCAWDWMCRNNLRGVDFDPQLNQPSVNYFIDFASKFGLAFSLTDDGWVKGDAINDDTLFLKGDYRIDIKKAAEYAKSKNVKYMLWALAKNIAHDPENSFKMIAENGVAGLKIDFIERDDQLANQMCENFARLAAKYKLVIFFHGCMRPTGMNRTYPNILSYESVRGNEFPHGMSPEQNVKIAQSRNLVGPLDYTPGVMTNTQDTPGRLRDILITKGTRASQMALFVMFHSPIQMVCDSPTTYEREPEVIKFLAQIPTVWDDTKGVNCKMDEYATIARRKGDVWYLAGLTVKGDHNRKQNLGEFLDKNTKYTAEIYRDTTNSHKIGMDFKREIIEVGGGDTITFPIANNGGFIMKFTKKTE
ncbi:MAG: glycoside hydrolase family 97 catalytic domain-containing protein, partial [Opitutales bacterium]|nr:glycoside hydrolase family 97 catalytic domain-containing protein [Opitutales bacterium]